MTEQNDTPAPTQTVGEQRAELQTQVLQLDLDRATAAKAILNRKAVQTAILDLVALQDDRDPNAHTRAATRDVNALVACILLPLQNGVRLCEYHEQQIAQEMNNLASPPPPPPSGIENGPSDTPYVQPPLAPEIPA